MTSLMTSISGERDSRWAWSWARRFPSLSEDPRWPRDTTLLQEVSKLKTLKENPALLKVRVRGWMSAEMVGRLPLLCHPRLAGQHLLQVDRIRWVNHQLRISPNMNRLWGSFPLWSLSHRTTCVCFAKPKGNFLPGPLTECLHWGKTFLRVSPLLGQITSTLDV